MLLRPKMAMPRSSIPDMLSSELSQTLRGGAARFKERVGSRELCQTLYKAAELSEQRSWIQAAGSRRSCGEGLRGRARIVS